MSHPYTEEISQFQSPQIIDELILPHFITSKHNIWSVSVMGEWIQVIE